MAKSKKIIAYFDGACRGNPGPGSYGYHIDFLGFSNKSIDRESIESYGLVEEGTDTTNNRAEMSGLYWLLKKLNKEVSEDERDKVIIRGDSLLVINGVTGKWQKKANKDLWKKIEKYAHEEYTYEQIPRAQNKRADALANKALDE